MTLDVLVRSITWEAPDIHSFELVPLHGALPAFTAGAHIDVCLPNGLTRQYSLHNAPGETHRYLISVLKLSAGRGGSEAMHQVRVGQVLSVSEPKNHFELAEHARRHLLVAGGIGITPLLAMVQRLDALELDYALHYCCRERDRAAFIAALAGREANGKVTIHCDGGVPGRGLDVVALFASVSPDTQVYCCGPNGLMAAVKAATAHWPSGSVHFESFASPAPAPVESSGTVKVKADVQSGVEFEIELALSHRIIGVSKMQTMLQALRGAGIDVESSCEAGTCGTCKTRFLAGVPDHQDFYLGSDEMAQFVMPCVSRCKSRRIVLDL